MIHIYKDIETNLEIDEIIIELENKFEQVSLSCSNNGNRIIIESIQASFGSINRNDTTSIVLEKSKHGFLAHAHLEYKPSFYFWFNCASPLFPLIMYFYFSQKRIVQDEIKEVFEQVNNKVATQGISKTKKQIDHNFEYLEKLNSLRKEGILTEDEFQTKKKEVL